MFTVLGARGERYAVPETPRQEGVPPHTRHLTCADDCAKLCGRKRVPRGKIIKTAEGELRNTLFEEAVRETLLASRVCFRGYHYAKGARDNPPFGWEGRTEVILRCQYSLSERARVLDELQSQGMIQPEYVHLQRIIEH